MNPPFDEILTVIREACDLTIAFNNLRAIGKSRVPVAVWDEIPTPEVETDLWLAGGWLKESIDAFQPSGVYLGLDTLNENRGRGKNVEIGMTREADPQQLVMDWAFRLPKYGKHHLIEGLYEVHSAYETLGLGLLADYLFFFGYSGVVLAAALERINIHWNCLFIWGFHDGDLGYLARSSGAGVTRLATLGNGA